MGIYGLSYRVARSSNLVDWDQVDFAVPQNVLIVLPDDPDGDGSAEWIRAEVEMSVGGTGDFLKLETVLE